jgi:hypothetical protein
MPKNLFDDTDKWMKQAKYKLDIWTKNSSNSAYIGFDMLEHSQKKSDDIIFSGERILHQMDDRFTGFSYDKVNKWVSEL